MAGHPYGEPSGSAAAFSRVPRSALIFGPDLSHLACGGEALFFCLAGFQSGLLTWSASAAPVGRIAREHHLEGVALIWLVIGTQTSSPERWL